MLNVAYPITQINSRITNVIDDGLLPMARPDQCLINYRLVIRVAKKVHRLRYPYLFRFNDRIVIQ